MDLISLAHVNAKWISSPLGSMLAVADDRGILLLDFIERADVADAAGRVQRRLGGELAAPKIAFANHPHLTTLAAELAGYFAGERQKFTVSLHPLGTDFELRAWKYLRTIPYGQTRSYGQQATALGDPNAARAVGGANGRNNIAVLIPCHRVIGSTGHLTGYASGIERKRWLLDHEKQAAKNEHLFEALSTQVS